MMCPVRKFILGFTRVPPIPPEGRGRRYFPGARRGNKGTKATLLTALPLISGPAQKTCADAHPRGTKPHPVRALDQFAAAYASRTSAGMRSEEHTSELQSRGHLVCRLLLAKKNRKR